MVIMDDLKDLRRYMNDMVIKSMVMIASAISKWRAYFCSGALMTWMMGSENMASELLKNCCWRDCLLVFVVVLVQSRDDDDDGTP